MAVKLENLLSDIISTYGKNPGYHIPTISWSKENMLSRYGEFQYWNNHIIVSNLLNTELVSVEAIKSVIFHEYTHQLYRNHGGEFNARMELFPNYDRCNRELEDYFNGLDEFIGEVLAAGVDDFCVRIVLFDFTADSV